jgi:hypothetical protein
VDGGLRRRRRLDSPEALDQLVAGHDLVRMQKEDGEYLALARLPKRKLHAVAPNLQRPEHPKVHA